MHAAPVRAAEPSGGVESWGTHGLLAGFAVQLEAFEGPLDLLLVLIRREKLAVNRLSLAAVTGQYLAFIGSMEAIEAGAVAAFCDVASTLMVLKSRAMLPRAAAADDGEDEALDLVERLRAFKRYRMAAERLGRREQVGLRAFVRPAGPQPLAPELRSGDLDVRDLARAFQRALAEAQAAESAALAATGAVLPPSRPRVRLADRFREIRDLLHRQGRVTFRQALFGARSDREYVLVSFLAVLELLRRRVARATQAEVFGEIELEARADFKAWSTEISEHALDEVL